jgi:hypothetical protein
MKTCLVPKYLQKKKESKVVMLFSLPLPKDTLLIIKEFVYYDDPLRMTMKITFKTSVIRQLRDYGSIDYEEDDTFIWEEEEEEEEPLHLPSRMNFYMCWEMSSTVCLSCGNYLCGADMCYRLHAQRVHCLCKKQLRVHSHHPLL